MRTFVAIEIDELTRQRITELQDALRAAVPRLRWSDPRRMHLTLKFLGEVDESRIELIRAELERVAAGTASFKIRIREVGVFPPSGPPRVVWVGAKGESGALTRCRDAVEAGIAPLGFPTEDRPYRPHLTLARCPDSRITRSLPAMMNEHRHFDAGEMTVRQFVFFRSTLTRQGPIYEPISTHDFRM